MDLDPPHLRNSRVKACTECRQQKLRCDAAQFPNNSCSRCRRRNLKCVITSNFVRAKRKTKSELQQELEQLKEQMHHPTQESPSRNSAHTHPSLTPQQSNSIGPGGPSPQTSLDGFRPSSAGIPSEPTYSIPREATHPRTLRDVEVTATAIDDCFGLFFSKYAPHMQAVEMQMEPNECYDQSRYLFWTIMTVGARKYTRDPTLLSQLTPHILDMTKNAAFSTEKSLNTIQAFMLLCTWPVPHQSIGKDITHILSGVLLQHTLSVGLHIFGVGQDFARIKLRQDRAQLYSRARLWALCIVICQRISCTDGVPPVYIPDNYDHSYCQAQTINALPLALRFSKTLSRILTESILELEKYALSKPMSQRGPVLNPIIDAASLSLADLEPTCPADIDRFYLISAELQILSFHLLGPKESFQDTKLIKMHDLSCQAIELLESLERNEGFCDHAPLAAMKYLSLASFSILKLSRSHVAEKLDLGRGKTAYFGAISLCRKAAVESEDIIARLAKILTQLWNSKQLFRKADGTLDPLTLRCGSRLAMSISYDCFWWWRSEFAGVENPYDEKEQNGGMDGLSPESFQNLVWLQESFPEFAWPAMEDLVSMDWPAENTSAPAPVKPQAPIGGPLPDIANSIWM